ncbi:MAG: hypothetical protein SPF12_00540 [Prevotella sp.]|nr:hypothetical protein [Prevotella sp.]
MIPQIVYVLVANEKNLYLEEMWVSIFSLRRHHPEATVKVLVDMETKEYLSRFTQLTSMIDETVVVQTPAGYNAKQRSRQIKTTIRNVLKGDYIFIDTDTVICKPLDGIVEDIAEMKDFRGIAAVREGHATMKDTLFPPTGTVKRIFDIDISQSPLMTNSGVMFVADIPFTHEFYKRWNENWKRSCFEKGNSQDQPSLYATDCQYGYVIRELSGIYNAQVAMSLKYYADAVILHWWHMDFIEDQSYSPYFSLEIYKDLKKEGEITPQIEELIINAKQSFVSPTMPVGKEHILFLFSPAGKIFNRIYKEGGAASWLMLKMAKWLERIHHYTKKR